MTCSTSWAREAWKSRISVRGVHLGIVQAVTARRGSARRWRCRPARGLPAHPQPCWRRYSASGAIWEVLPQPSEPSRVMNISYLSRGRCAPAGKVLCRRNARSGWPGAPSGAAGGGCKPRRAAAPPSARRSTRLDGCLGAVHGRVQRRARQPCSTERLNRSLRNCCIWLIVLARRT